jgi:glycosyltransferase involved in cell wall biosynthesis
MSSTCRILHVVGAMNRGGIETWLMHVLRTIDRERFQMDFLVHTDRPGVFDEELLSLGSRLLHCPYAHQPLAYIARFRQLVAENGPYQVVHSHVHYFNGLVLRLAKSMGIPRRIAHSHNDPSSAEARRGLMRHGYAWLASRWIHRYATGGFGGSRCALASLFGDDWQSDQRWHPLSYAIDLAAFRLPIDRAAVCAEIGVPANALLVGHTGRFVEQKNHAFLLRIVQELMRVDPSTHLVLLGDGHLRPEMERQAAAAGIGPAVHFLGVRPDVPRIVRGAMDMFMFPSHFEGLGLVVVEAQAAGLPCLISKAVPEEADVVPGLVHRLSLDDPPEVWAQAALRVRSAPRAISPAEALSAIAASSFNIEQGVQTVEQMYGELCDGC